MCDDERLQYLLNQIGQLSAVSSQRKRCMQELLKHIQTSPKLFRSKHRDYYSAVGQTLIWVIKKIEGFRPESPPPTNAEEFIWWVNGYLKWRLKDLNCPDVEYLPKRFTAVPLDKSFEDGHEKSETIAASGSLSGLEEMIQATQQAQKQRIGWQIQDYIQQDPQGILRSYHLRGHPECNCQMLAIRIQLSEPPQQVKYIAAEFGVPEQTLYTHWRVICKPRLRLLALRFDEQLKQGIADPEARARLSQCQLQDRPECNCWTLTELLLLVDPAKDVAAIAQEMNISKQLDIWNHWEKKCLPILKLFRS